MKKSFILLGMLAISLANAQEGNVGINTTDPKATLDIRPNAENAQDGKTTNEGLLVPRLKKSRVGTMQNPENYTLVIVESVDTSTDPRVINITAPGFYFFDKPNNTWKALGSEAINQTQMLSATYVEATGTWMQNIATNGNTVTFRVTNTSSFSFAGINFNQALTLNGASQGLSYTPVQDYSAVSFTPNQTRELVYNISGTPNSFGTLTASLNAAGLTAFGNIPVQEASQTKAMSITFAGDYQAQKPLNSANTLTLQVHNFTTQAVNAVNMKDAIELSGIDGVSVVPNQNTNVTIPAGQSRWLTYKLTGTPTSSGTLVARFNPYYQISGNVSGSQVVSQMTGVSSTSIALEGDYFVSQRMENTNVVRITLRNNNAYPINNLDLSQALSLSNVGAAGVSIPTGQNTNVSIPASGTQTITYTLTGAPTQGGTITANWANNLVTGTQTANRQVAQWEITPETITVADFRQNNYNFSITVNSTESWGAELVNGGADAWIKNIRTNNTSGNGTILFDTVPHDTTTPGGYRIRVYKTSDPSNGKYVYVFQQSNVSTPVSLPQTFFDIAGDTQYIETNYAGPITAIQKPDWVTSITQEGTRLKVTSAPRTDIGGRKFGRMVLEYGAGYRQSYSNLTQRQKANVCPATKPDWVPANVLYYRLANGATLPPGAVQWTEYVGDFNTASRYYGGGDFTANVSPIDGEYATTISNTYQITNLSTEFSNLDRTWGAVRLTNGTMVTYIGLSSDTYNVRLTAVPGDLTYVKSGIEATRVVFCFEFKDNY